MMHTKPTGSLQVHAAAGRAGSLVNDNARSRSTKFDSDVTSPVLQNEQLHYGATLHHIRV